MFLVNLRIRRSRYFKNDIQISCQSHHLLTHPSIAIRLVGSLYGWREGICVLDIFMGPENTTVSLNPNSASLRIHNLTGMSNTDIIDTNVAGLLISSIPLSE
ncbi:MAG: hypothetical protein WCF03_13440 [Nitrososphaeraceae archaeon]